MPQLVLELKNIAKEYYGNRVLKGVSLQVRPGTVHALVGENGAGKSTLLKILAGIVRPDRGDVRLDDVPLHLANPRDALSRGIGMV